MSQFFHCWLFTELNQIYFKKWEGNISSTTYAENLIYNGHNNNLNKFASSYMVLHSVRFLHTNQVRLSLSKNTSAPYSNIKQFHAPINPASIVRTVAKEIRERSVLTWDTSKS